MRHIYTLVLILLLPFVLLHLGWLSLRNPGYRQRWRERFGFIPVPPAMPVIWVHAASVGEVQAAAPLIERLLAAYPGYQIVVSTLTPTGARTVEQRFRGQVRHVYLPYDLPGMIRRFLTRMQPQLLLVMEMEIWPNLYHECHARQVPLILVNARMSERSATAYARLPALIGPTLRQTTLIAAQSREDADRLIRLGAPAAQTVVTGNLKFDIRLPHSITEQAQVVRRSLSVNRPLWIAASTHEGEERQVLDAFEQVRQQYPDCLLVLVPRHPERFDRVAELCRRRELRIARRSQVAVVDETVAVYLVDTMGDLPVCYAAADIAFVGGSLVDGVGGHNILEPAGLAVPILTGPYHENFREITRSFREQGAAWIVRDAADLAAHVVMLLNDPNLRYQAGQKGQAIIAANSGGIDELVGLLEQYIPQE